MRRRVSVYTKEDYLGSHTGQGSGVKETKHWSHVRFGRRITVLASLASLPHVKPLWEPRPVRSACRLSTAVRTLEDNRMAIRAMSLLLPK